MTATPSNFFDAPTRAITTDIEYLRYLISARCTSENGRE
jgi:hypothetical protein